MAESIVSGRFLLDAFFEGMSQGESQSITILIFYCLFVFALETRKSTLLKWLLVNENYLADMVAAPEEARETLLEALIAGVLAAGKFCPK